MVEHYFKPNPNFCFKLIVFLAAAGPHCLCFHGSASRAFTTFSCPLCVCNFFHFHRIFCFGSNKHHSPRHVALRLRLLPLLVVDIFPESDPFLDRRSPAVQGDYMARYNYAPVMSNPVLVWEVFLSLNGCQTQPHLNPVCPFCGVCLAELWLKFDRAFHCQLFEKLGGLCLAYN